MKQVIMGTVTLSLLAASAPAYAQIGVGVDADTVISSDRLLNAQVQSQVDAQVDADNIRYTTQVVNEEGADEREIELLFDTRTGVESESSVGEEQAVNTNGRTESNNRVKISIGGKLLGVDTDVRVAQATEVNTDEELGAYARVVAENDSRINLVAASDNEVRLRYEEPVRVFGLFDARIAHTARVSVDNDGELYVRVSRPWWSVFVSGDADIDSAVEADIANRLSAGFDAGAEMTARTQAEIISAIEAAMSAHLSAAAEAKTNADTDVDADTNVNADVDANAELDTDVDTEANA